MLVFDNTMMFACVNAPTNAAEQFKKCRGHIPSMLEDMCSQGPIYKANPSIETERLTSSGAQAPSPSSTSSCSYQRVAALEYLRTPIP